MPHLILTNYDLYIWVGMMYLLKGKLYTFLAVVYFIDTIMNIWFVSLLCVGVLELINIFTLADGWQCHARTLYVLYILQRRLGLPLALCIHSLCIKAKVVLGYVARRLPFELCFFNTCYSIVFMQIAYPLCAYCYDHQDQCMSEILIQVSGMRYAVCCQLK